MRGQAIASHKQHKTGGYLLCLLVGWVLPSVARCDSIISVILNMDNSAVEFCCR